MSASRIKYIDHKFKEGCKISAKSYTSESTGAKYRSILNIKEMEFYIRNERTKELIFKSDKYTNMNVLKRNARAKLEKLGVNLGKEVRNRTFGRCSEGYTQQTHEMLQNLDKE